MAAGCQTYPPTSYQVCGRIRDKYNQTNGPNGFLLFPKSNELTNPNNTGKRSEFLGGNIYWSTATDAHPVAHDFLTKWGEKGYESGFLKYPTTDEIVLPDGINRRQEYQGGSIYWAAGIGAHSIQGLIREKWLQLGGPSSELGFPISDELNNSFNYYSQFQGGTIYWSSTTGVEVVFTPFGFATPADDEPECTMYNLEMCNQEAGLEKVKDDLDKCMAYEIGPDQPVFGIHASSRNPQFVMSCERYRHVADRHRADLDQDNFLKCLSLVHEKGNDWTGADPPNSGIKWQNSRSSVWGYISYNPNLKNAIWTMFTSGNQGADWGGCARGY